MVSAGIGDCDDHGGTPAADVREAPAPARAILADEGDVRPDAPDPRLAMCARMRFFSSVLVIVGVSWRVFPMSSSEW